MEHNMVLTMANYLKITYLRHLHTIVGKIGFKVYVFQKCMMHTLFDDSDKNIHERRPWPYFAHPSFWCHVEQSTFFPSCASIFDRSNCWSSMRATKRLSPPIEKPWLWGSILFCIYPGSGLNTVVSFLIPIPHGWIIRVGMPFGFRLFNKQLFSSCFTSSYESRFLYSSFKILLSYGSLLAKTFFLRSCFPPLVRFL